ncbi:MAG: hypothetical protein E2O29_01650 [Deltaproteobacteria bacterium]|nr:MAG: hypothetical protein E2O29_01650 [Deltaproteobacteria bacterium]
MNLRDQLCDSILGEQLKKLGVPQESMWYWSVPEKRWVYHIDRKSTYVYVQGKRYEVNYVSLFTVAELGELLPAGYRTYRIGYKWYNDAGEEDHGGWVQKKELIFDDFDTEADARATMYAHLLVNGIVKL